ncbi:ammonium transporter [Mesorhizobium sp. M7A.F.Ca.US.001.04.1.1]|nr:ammonium transporter [Mesorhizobium sp. M7A.F.Ca.US.001.04.2.1]RUY35735.1 ammonium transporter [Mesorhizobium sp. M7A.F.Ca.US.001.04.1.1]
MNIPSTLKTTGRAALLGSLALAALGTVAAFAQEAAPAAAAAAPAAAPTPVLDTGNTAWMLTSTALVLMMTIPGLALFYGGMVRKKNVLATVMQSFAITCLVTVLWFMFGYSLAFSDGGGVNSYIGGTSKFFHHGITTASLWLPGVANIPEFVFSMFQMTFAIITPALIAGAFAERMKFSALLIFMALWLLVVYVPIAHWVWGGGFLGSAGVLDFAGGTVVHINAGVAGLVCALVLGKREGYGTTNMAPHNLVYSVIGASLLWVGWFGFNAGSELAADGLAGAAMLNTQVATAAAALAWMFAEWIVAKKPSVLGIISGAVAGLVAVTPASGFVNPTGAFIVGIVAGVVCYLSAVKVKHMFGYDDSLDAFGVHGVGGVVGALLTGVLADPAINSLGAGASLGKQIYGVALTIVWTGIATFVLLYIVKALVGLRPTTQEEVEGLDISQHGEVVP